MRSMILVITILSFAVAASGQDIMKIGERTNKKIQRKVESGINRGIDRTINDAEKDIRNSMKSKPQKDSGKKTGDSKTKEPGQTGVTEKYDFKPMSKSVLSFNANNMKDDNQTTESFNQVIELVQLDGFKGKWIKLLPNSAYCPIMSQAINGDWAIEMNLLPQVGESNKSDINFSIALVGENDYNRLFSDSGLDAHEMDSLYNYVMVQINKPASKDELNILTKTRMSGTKPLVRKKKYIPVNSEVNRNTFAISNTGSITKVYYCNRKITSFQNKSQDAMKIILFVIDDSGESALYLQDINITSK